MLLSAVSVLVVAQSSSEIPEGLMNNPVQSAPRNGTASAGSLDKASDHNYKYLRTQLALNENIRGFSLSFPPDTQTIFSVYVATTSVYVAANVLSATSE